MTTADEPSVTRSSGLLRHGGARRKRGERSRTLTSYQCQRIIDAAFAAHDTGRSLNRWITITWALGGLKGYEGPQATVAFLKRYRDWMRRHGEKAYWVYSHETGPLRGIHVHLLLHVPPRLNAEFRRCPLRWTKASLRTSYVARTLKTRKVSAQQACDADRGELYELWLRFKLHYMLKTASRRAELHLGVRGWSWIDWGRESEVLGKRYGCWQGWQKALNANIL